MLRMAAKTGRRWYSTLLTQNLAQTGEGIKECEVVQWFVKPGDDVKEYDLLCRVQSDKATVDVTSIFSGVVQKVSCPEGGLVAVGQPLVEYYGDGSRRTPMRGYQRAMAKSMKKSASIPHCYAFDTVALPQNFPGPITPHAILALAKTVQQVPLMQAKLTTNEDLIEIPGDVHIAVAMNTPHGLAVPCVRNAQDKSIRAIDEELQLLKQKAIDRQLTKQDIEGSTITISNIGSLGIASGLACIQPGQCSIITLGRLTDDGNKKFMHVSVAGDHRLIDGSTLASFLSKFSSNMECPF